MSAKLKSRHQIDLAAEAFRDMRRDFAVDRAAIKKEERTVELSFASEAPVDRWFGREILDMTPEACKMDRLNNGAALLMDHNWSDQVGVVMKSWIDAATKKARCLVKFSRSARGEEIFQDIQDGIRSLVSVGYVVRKMVLQSVDGDVETHRVTEWEPFEVSVVAVPADSSVGVGRSASPDTNRNQSLTMNDATTGANGTSVTINADTRTQASVTNDGAAVRAQIKEINTAVRTYSQKYPQHADAIRALGDKCLETGDSIEAFRTSLLNDIMGTRSDVAPVRQGDALVGMSRKEVKRYSVLRAIRLQSEGRPLDGLERECNDELAKRLERQPRGFFLPDEVIADHRAQRTMTAGVPADGGYTVGEQLLQSEFVSLLRNNAKVVSLGGRYISGLQGDVSIPRQLTGATVYWVSETGTISSSGATFGQIVAKPRRVGTSVPYTKQFLAQTSLGAEAFVVQDSDEATAVDLDRVAIRGAGGAEPLGILNLASGDRSTSVTFSGAATWAKYLEFFSNVASNNALLGTPAYLTTPASAAKAMAIAKFTNGDVPIWTGDNKIGSFRAEWSTNFATSGTINQVIFGDFSQVIFLEWAGRDVVVDPYSGKKEGTVEITIQRLIDCVIRRGKSFAISTDSGAQ